MQHTIIYTPMPLDFFFFCETHTTNVTRSQRTGKRARRRAPNQRRGRITTREAAKGEGRSGGDPIKKEQGEKTAARRKLAAARGLRRPRTGGSGAMDGGLRGEQSVNSHDQRFGERLFPIRSEMETFLIGEDVR